MQDSKDQKSLLNQKIGVIVKYDILIVQEHYIGYSPVYIKMCPTPDNEMNIWPMTPIHPAVMSTVQLPGLNDKIMFPNQMATRLLY